MCCAMGTAGGGAARGTCAACGSVPLVPHLSGTRGAPAPAVPPAAALPRLVGGNMQPGPPAPTGRSFQRRQLQPFPAEGAGGRARDMSPLAGPQHVPAVGLCRGGGCCTRDWCSRCWWEWGTPGRSSRGAPMGDNRTSFRAPMRMCVHTGTFCSAAHVEGQRDRAHGKDSSLARGPGSRRVCGGAGSSPPGCESSCLFAQASIAVGRAGGPGRCERLQRWCLGRGSCSLLRASLDAVPFTALWAAWCFPLTQLDLRFPLKGKGFFEMQNAGGFAAL